MEEEIKYNDSGLGELTSWMSNIMDVYKEIDLEGEYFLKKVDGEEIDRVGWIVLDQFKDSTVTPISLESIPDAWCGVEFKVSIISYGVHNIILGSPELMDYPIDKEDLVGTLKEILSKAAPSMYKGIFTTGEQFITSPTIKPFVNWDTNTIKATCDGICQSK